MENKIFRPVITIDGPAASGKGTITKRIAKDLNLILFRNRIFLQSNR